jgi:hypothetical protein
MYAHYVDNDPNVSISSTQTLGNLLHLKVPKTLDETVFLKRGDLVTNFDGGFLRVKQLDYVDQRVGRLPLVYDIEKDKTYAHIAHLVKIEEVEFDKSVDVALRLKLANKLKYVNCLIIDGEIVKVGDIYIDSDREARAYIRARGFITITEAREFVNQK